MFAYKGVFIVMLLFSVWNCDDSLNLYQYAKSDIERFKEIHESVPLKTFNNWNISMRYDVTCFDFDIYRLIVKTDSANHLMLLEVLPKPDTTFVSIADKEGNNTYPFSLTDLSAMYRIIKSMNISKVVFRDDFGIIIFKLEHSTLIYTEKQVDISTMKRFEVYEKYDNNWYYSTLQHTKE